MRETCIKSKVLGFAHEHTPVAQGPREQRTADRPSLLSQLLKDPSCQPYEEPYEAVSDSDTDMEEPSDEDHDSDSEMEERRGGTAPMKIPSTS